MRLRRPPRTAIPDDTSRATWGEITAGADAPVVVIHARRASEVVEDQQVA